MKIWLKNVKYSAFGFEGAAYIDSKKAGHVISDDHGGANWRVDQLLT